MRAVAVPMADPRLEFHWTPDPGFLIQSFLIQCLPPYIYTRIWTHGRV